MTPVLAAKYPPGNSLLLAPGAAVGAPALTPILCMGIAAGFLFLLARRFSNVWVASWAWLLWTSAPATLRYLCGYLSENVTVALWLVGWWGLANWREKGGAGWLSVFATAVAWSALTRPLTALAYAATGGVFVLLELARRRRPSRDLAPARASPLSRSCPCFRSGVGTTTGLGASDPVPRLGSGLPSGRPARLWHSRPPPRPSGSFRRTCRLRWRSTRTSTPGTGPRRSSRSPLGRAAQIGRDFWGGWRAPLVALFLIGLFVVPREGRFAVATALLLFVSHLVYAHDPGWSIYYVEAAAGARLGHGGRRRRRAHGARETAHRRCALRRGRRNRAGARVDRARGRGARARDGRMWRLPGSGSTSGPCTTITSAPSSRPFRSRAPSCSSGTDRTTSWTCPSFATLPIRRGHRSGSSTIGARTTRACSVRRPGAPRTSTTRSPGRSPRGPRNVAP